MPEDTEYDVRLDALYVGYQRNVKVVIDCIPNKS
jgi:hypothetical protein